MALYNGPLKSGNEIFNVSDYDYQNNPVTLSTLQLEMQNQTTTDEVQDALVNSLVASTNTLSTSISANTAYQAKVNTLEGKTVELTIEIEDDIEQEALELMKINKNVKISGDLRVKDAPIQCGDVNNRIMLAKGLYSTNKGIKLNYNSTDDCGEIECQKLHVRHTLKLNGVDIENLNNKVTAIDTSRRIRCHTRITGTPIVTMGTSTNCTATKLAWGTYEVVFGSEVPPNKHYHVVITGNHITTAFTQFQVSQDLSTGLAKFVFYSRDIDFVKVDLGDGTYNISVSW